MPNLDGANPLMQSLFIHGQEYLASQRIHQDYIQNTRERGEKPKHVRHDSFKRVVRLIPSYELYVEQHDILRYEWNAVKRDKSEGTQFLCTLLRPLFSAAGWSDLLLLNKTAQLELTHHLDDELNQEIAYRHSAQTTAQVINAKDLFLRKLGFLPYKSTYDFDLFYELCRVWGVKLPKDDGSGQHWPGCGALFNKFIYALFPKEVQEDLGAIPRKPSGGLLRHKHLRFTEEMREKALRARQTAMMSLLRLCDDGDKDLFLDLLARHDARIGLTIQVSHTMHVRLKMINANQLLLFEPMAANAEGNV